MNTKELIKKYWFIGVVAIVLIAFIGLYAVDTYKNREITVNSKQIDGKYVAYTLDDQPVYADDLYESLYDAGGLSQVVVAYERAVLNAAYETTEEMNNIAANSASSILSSYSQSYIISSLESMGYYNGIDDLTQYYVDAQKQEMMIKEYVSANTEEYLSPLVGTNGRIIYHILVKCDTTPVNDEEGNIIAYEANPTQEQTDKLNEVLAYLQDENNRFEYAAYQYSEDTGSAQQGGYIGMINEENAEIYDQMFAKASHELEENEVSEPIVSSFGYHIIKNAGSSTENILNDFYYLSELENNYPTLALKAIMLKAEELGFEIKDEDIKAQILSQLESEAE